MAFIIPDKILDTLICDICNKYLSVQPVKVYPNRRIKCGRCVRNKKVGDGALSLFGLIADACLFKCVNRFDGCREVLFHSQVRDHERMCISKIYKCPICPESDELTSLLLEQHFQKNHSQSVLKYPGFFLNLSASSELNEIFLYRLEELLFFVTFIYSHIEDNMRFNISLLGTSEQAINIIQQFCISDDEAVEISTEKKPCTSFEMENNWFYIRQLKMDKKSIMVKFDLEIIAPQFIRITNRPVHSNLQSNNELITFPSLMAHGLPFVPMVVQFELRKLHLPQKVQFISLSPCATAIITFRRLIYLQCINCYELCCVGDFFPYWYSCDIDKEHSLCYFCFQFLKCLNYIREEDYTQEALLRSQLALIEFSCKWACGKRFDFTSLTAHEANCQSLNRACFLPKCDFHATSLKNIEKHFSEEHADQNFFLRHYYHGKLAIGRIILLVDNQFVFIDIEKCSDSRRRIVMKSDTENGKLIALLFDDSKEYLTKFRNQIIVKRNEKAYYLKIIVMDRN